MAGSPNFTQIGRRDRAGVGECPLPEAELQLCRQSYGVRPPPVKAWMLTLPVDTAALLSPAVFAPSHVRAFLVACLITIVVFHNAGLYRAMLHVSVLDEIPSLLGRAILAAAVVALVTVARHPTSATSDYLRWAVLAILLLVVGRIITSVAILRARKSRVVQHPTLIYGYGAIGRELGRLLGEYPSYGLHVVAYIDDVLGLVYEKSEDGTAFRQSRHSVGEVVARKSIDVVLIADTADSDAEMVRIISSPFVSNCDLLVVPRLHEFHTQSAKADHVGGIPVMRIRRPIFQSPARVVKRAFDVVVSIAALIILAPLLLVISAAVRWEGGPGIIFRQARVTRDGKSFNVLKFRSMKPDDDQESGTRWSIAGDNRIGPVGKIIRRTSLDELPQLINILAGDMTLVGPRPERPLFVNQFSADYPTYGNRHRVPAGLTGLAQVSGLRGDTSIADRTRLDNFYIENWSLWLDVKVVLRTIGEVLFGRGR